MILFDRRSFRAFDYLLLVALSLLFGIGVGVNGQAVAGVLIQLKLVVGLIIV